MKNYILLIFAALLSFTLPCYSQTQVKLNFGAALAADAGSRQEESIHLLVRGNVSEVQRVVEIMEGTFRYAIADISSVILKAKYIQTLSNKPFVVRIEADNPFSKTQVMNDTMLVNNRVVAVHAGVAPLSQAYKGDGVVVGIIDTGIDYKHPDFKDSNGKTRIKFLWDQVLPDSASPLPYNYGQEWTGADIDNGKATRTMTTAESNFGHGTQVSSVATGNGLAVGNYKGVAPNADIIFVAADLSGSNSIVDAAKYIYAKASLLGKPCVINVSLGDYYGAHDGLDLKAQSIKNLILAKSGRCFVAAAGNAGHIPFHLGYTVTSDTNFTWFSGGAYIAMYADTNDLKNVKFAIGADKITPTYSFRGNTSFSNIAQHLGVTKFDTVYNGPNRICTVTSFGDLTGGVYSMEFLISPDTSTYQWRLMTTGSGKFDAWTFDMELANLADTIVFPPLRKYKQPDLNSNMVNSFQCLDEVITVGNYTNRNRYIDYDTILRTDPARVPGTLFNSSSHGPTRDGRIKPDITSPGDWTLSALVTTQIASNLAAGLGHYMGQGGYHYLNGGTSLASPGVAGIAALYLQMDSTADWFEVKNAITNCARLDVQTGLNLPDSHWGYGKADAFLTLTGCATSSNNNQNIEFQYFNIYPNPASEVVNFKFNLPGELGNTQLIIHDLVGKKIKVIEVKERDHVVLKTSTLRPGIYFCTLQDREKILATQKLVISE